MTRNDSDIDGYHENDGSLSKRIGRALHKAKAGISRDVNKMLDSIGYKGGFSSKQEAEAYLDSPAPRRSIRNLIRKSQTVSNGEDVIKKAQAESRGAEISRKEAVKATIELNETQIVDALETQTRPALKVAEIDAFGHQSYEIQKDLDIGYRVDVPNVTAAEHVLDEMSPATEEAMDLALKGVAEASVDEMKDSVMSMMLEGKSTPEIVDAISKQTGADAGRVKRMVRTLITEASAAGELQSLQESGFERYEYIATKDERTCPICGRLDGKEFDVSEKKVGVNCPPMHPNCRCTVAMALEQWEKEALTKAARDENGDSTYIPGTWTYEDWAKKYYKQGYDAVKKG